MSEVNYFRACWAGSPYRNEQFIPENRWKQVTGKYLHEHVLSVSTRLVNVSQFRKHVRAGCPRGQPTQARSLNAHASFEAQPCGLLVSVQSQPFKISPVVWIRLNSCNFGSPTPLNPASSHKTPLPAPQPFLSVT